MRYRVFLDQCAGVVEGQPIYGTGEPLGETDDLDQAKLIAMSSAVCLHQCTAIIDDDGSDLWWYDEQGEEQLHGY